MTAAKRVRWSSRRHPFIGPTRCPLHLWFLEYRDDRGVWRRYFADRPEARAALREMRRASKPQT